jgi:hypothetical protein
MVAPKRKIFAVISLFLVAPLVAEYLLGDLPLKLLSALIVLAPAYGGGALLIRETARRTGRGWPTMLMLGAAYTLIGEGLVSQSLFNPDYMQKHWHLLYPAYLPALGIGGWWTLLMFNLHTFWSMGVSIALVEALFPADAEAPWLGRRSGVRAWFSRELRHRVQAEPVRGIPCAASWRGSAELVADGVCVSDSDAEIAQVQW